MPTEIHRRAILRAIEISGDVEALAAHLRVPSTAVRLWANGTSPLPGDLFLRIVDLLLDRSLMELHPPAPRATGTPGPDTSGS